MALTHASLCACVCAPKFSIVTAKWSPFKRECLSICWLCFFCGFGRYVSVQWTLLLLLAGVKVCLDFRFYVLCMPHSQHLTRSSWSSQQSSGNWYTTNSFICYCFVIIDIFCFATFSSFVYLLLCFQLFHEFSQHTFSHFHICRNAPTSAYSCKDILYAFCYSIYQGLIDL